MNSTVVTCCVLVLSAAAVLTLVRITKGPTMLDRVVALDVLVSVVVIALCVEAAANRHATTLPVIVVLAIVGFVGAVAVARFAARDGDLPSTEADDYDGYEPATEEELREGPDPEPHDEEETA